MTGGVTALADSTGQQRGVTRAQYRAQKDTESAFALLREHTERIGVFVLLADNLGSHHSAIPVEAFRGFAIADRIAPFVVINGGGARTAWSFTLSHALAHLRLVAIGVSGGGTSEMQIERFCTDVAGEFLLPRADVLAIGLSGLEVSAQIARITAYAGRLRVSRQMLAYHQYKAGSITLEAWQALDVGIRQRWAAERRLEKAQMKGSNGPRYYGVRRHRLGHAMLNFARRYTDAGALSPSKAAQVLGVKPRSVYPMLATPA